MGKTCLIKRFVDGVFDPDQGATVAMEAIDKEIDVDGEKITLRLCDT